VTDPGELAELLVTVSEALESLGVRWAIGGSLASAAYGEPRATNDVDVIVELDEGSARALTARLSDSFYVDADAAVTAARGGRCFNVIDERSFIKVDVFVPRRGRLGRGQLDRRQMLEVFPGVRVPVLGPEDVVLQKLRWYRLGGAVSDRQWRDILSVLRARELDVAYLEEVAAEADLDALLQRARTEAAG